MNASSGRYRVVFVIESLETLVHRKGFSRFLASLMKCSSQQQRPSSSFAIPGKYVLDNDVGFSQSSSVSRHRGFWCTGLTRLFQAALSGSKSFTPSSSSGFTMQLDNNLLQYIFLLELDDSVPSPIISWSEPLNVQRLKCCKQVHRTVRHQEAFPAIRHRYICATGKILWLPNSV